MSSHPIRTALALAAVPIDRARQFAREDIAAASQTPQFLGATDGERAIWRYSEDQPILIRERAMDQGDDWAWRFEQLCTTACHHPVHAFAHPERLRHVEWFAPGTTALIPASANPTPAPALAAKAARGEEDR